MRLKIPGVFKRKAEQPPCLAAPQSLPQLLPAVPGSGYRSSRGLSLPPWGQEFSGMAPSQSIVLGMGSSCSSSRWMQLLRQLCLENFLPASAQSLSQDHGVFGVGGNPKTSPVPLQSPFQPVPGSCETSGCPGPSEPPGRSRSPPAACPLSTGDSRQDRNVLSSFLSSAKPQTHKSHPHFQLHHQGHRVLWPSPCQGFGNENPFGSLGEDSGHDPKGREVLQETSSKPHIVLGLPQRENWEWQRIFCALFSSCGSPSSHSPRMMFPNQNQRCTGPGDDEFPIKAPKSFIRGVF